MTRMPAKPDNFLKNLNCEVFFCMMGISTEAYLSLIKPNLLKQNLIKQWAIWSEQCIIKQYQF